MTQKSIIERAQAWLQAADERGINVTDENGYLAVISDLVAEVETLRGAREGYRNTFQGLRAYRVLRQAVDAMTDAQRYAWLRGNAVREKNLGDKFIEFHCDFESWNDIDAAIDKARNTCEHRWKVTREGAQYMDSRCDRCGATKRETWD